MERELLSDTDDIGPFSDLPGYDEYTAASQRFFEAVDAVREDHGVRTVIVPSPLDLGQPDSLHTEREVWRDRINVMQRSAEPDDRSVENQVAKFLEDKGTNASAGLLTPGRINKLRGHLGHFRDWLGRETAVTEIKSRTLLEYRAELHLLLGSKAPNFREELTFPRSRTARAVRFDFPGQATLTAITEVVKGTPKR